MGWYAVIAKSRMDLRLAKALVAIGIDARVPRIYRRQKISSFAFAVPTRWLTPYVLVEVEEDEQFKTIRETLGFEDFLTLPPPAPTRIKSEIVFHILAQELESEHEAETPTRPRQSVYGVGQKVCIVQGPCKGEVGTVKEVIGGRLKIETRGPIPIIAKDREVMEA